MNALKGKARRQNQASRNAAIGAHVKRFYSLVKMLFLILIRLILTDFQIENVQFGGVGN